MDEWRVTLRFEIAENWSANDFAQFFSSVSWLYNLRHYLQFALDFEGRGPRILFGVGLEQGAYSHPFWGRRYLDNDTLEKIALRAGHALRVKRIEFASPGSIDLVGLGEIAGHLKDFVLRLIERSDTAKARELADDRAELENDRLRLENARSFVALAKDLGWSETQIRNLMMQVDEKQEAIARLADRKQIISVSTEE
jgi:hypothetical protein